MSELKEYMDKVFSDMRSRIDSEYKHQLKNHYANMTDNLSSTAFSPRYGELLKVSDDRIRLPKAIEGRWWIHMAYSNQDGPNRTVTINLYDNFGQPFIRKVTYIGFDNPFDFSQSIQIEDPKYQYPLTDSFIDFVKKQDVLNDLNTMGDLFHKIIYLYAF